MIGALKSVDITVRKSVRRWLNLLHDVPNAYFHAPVAEGGLGIPSLRWIAPLFRKNRLTTIRLGGDQPRTNFLERERERLPSVRKDSKMVETSSGYSMM